MSVFVSRSGILLVSLLLALALLLASSAARGESTQQVYEACQGSGNVPATDVPDRLDLERCPLEKKAIVDNGVGTVLPDPGEGVYVHATYVTGNQELMVTRYRDGTVGLEHVGDETEGARTGFGTTATGPGQCADRAYTDRDIRVDWTLSWYYNKPSIPGELATRSAVRAIRRGGANITRVRDACGFRDRVPHGLSFKGKTAARAGLDPNGRCTTNDNKTVVSFGSLPNGALGVTCTHFNPRDNGYNSVRESDIKLNSRHFHWTTRPKAPSCRRKYDVESTVTHERGHTFGLGEVSEGSHGNLTMSERSNGPCQKSERTLGRGDARGLNDKYR